jgi:chemotaxis protein MotB
MIADEAYEQVEEPENYFVSMTDMMTGLVFIFIILMMYYALQFKVTTSKFTDVAAERASIIEQIRTELQKRGVQVTIAENNSVLRLKDDVLFDSGQAELKPEGRANVEKLAASLRVVLPCYTDTARALRVTNCRATLHRVEALFIEGHTDTDAFQGPGMVDNLDLSAKRAANVYRLLKRADAALGQVCTQREGRCIPVLSVSGYGADRPVNGDFADKAHNRRIDLRLVMLTPPTDIGELGPRVAKPAPR